MNDSSAIRRRKYSYDTLVNGVGDLLCERFCSIAKAFRVRPCQTDQSSVVAAGIEKKHAEAMIGSKTPVVQFEKLDPADLSSALRSLTRLHRHSVIQPPIGIGYETFLQWALRDIEQAEKAGSGDDGVRASVNAVMSARRALSCLVDQYLQRDGFLFCQRPPREANEKTAILVSRGVFDALASQSLQRAVKRRNDVEHDYKSISLSEAQDVVHTVRATIMNAVTRSSPYDSPALFGTILGGYGHGSKGIYGSFHGWSGGAFLLVTTAQPLWAGVIVPTNETEAVVRRVDLGRLSIEQLLEALSVVESLLAGQGMSSSPNMWHAHLQSAGLLV